MIVWKVIYCSKGWPKCPAPSVCVAPLAAHYRRPPAELGADDVQAYLFHLARTLNYSPANLKTHVAAIEFLYTVIPNHGFALGLPVLTNHLGLELLHALPHLPLLGCLPSFKT